MNRLIFLLLLVVSTNIFAATRITPVNETMHVSKKGCDVTVYQTLMSALKNGEIEEICIIEGTSSGSLHHTAEVAIKKNAHEACGCGTDTVYVMSRSEPNGVTAHVAMVAFKYVNGQPANSSAAMKSPAVDPYEAMKRKKKD